MLVRLEKRQEMRRLAAFFGSYVASSSALLASSIATFLTFALLARTMGHEQFALNATITALTAVAVQVCGLGSMESLMRRVAQKPSFFPEMLGHVHILNLVSGAVLILIGMVALPLIFPVSESWPVTLATTAIILVTNIILLKIVWLATTSFIAHSEFATANKIEILFAVLRMIAAVLSCLVFHISTVVEWAVWNFAAHAIAATIALVLMNRLGRPKFVIVRDEVRLGLMFASQLFFKAARGNADILLLSAVVNSDLLGSYSIARRLMEASYMSVEALNRILYPGSAAVALQGMGRVYERAKRILLVTAGISLASACIVWLITPWLPALFGHEYVSLPGLNRYLCWVVIPVALGTTALEALGASGLQNIRARISNTASIIGVAAVAVATWQVGLDGVIASLYGVEIVAALVAWRVLSSYCGKTASQAPAESKADKQVLTNLAHAD